MPLFRGVHHRVGTTARIEAFSDAVLAIIITLLVLELHVPELHDLSVPSVLRALGGILPEFGSFAFSFVTLSVFWVNHHHFFHEVHRADGIFFWYNNFLLFWLSLIPFTTAFLGRYPSSPGVVMVYCFVLFMAALAYMLMARHAMFVANLLDAHITEEQKREQYRRGWVGVVCYGIATVSAPFFVPLSAVMMIFIPLYYIVPRLMHDHESFT